MYIYIEYYDKYLKYKNKYLDLKYQQGGAISTQHELFSKYNKEKDNIKIISRKDFKIDANEIKLGELLQNIFRFLNNYIRVYGKKTNEDIKSLFNEIFINEDLNMGYGYYHDNEDIETMVRLMTELIKLPLLKTFFTENISENIKHLYNFLIYPLLDENMSENIFNKYNIYKNLYNDTIKLFNDCETIGDSFIIYYKKNNLQMQMNINKISIEGSNIAEHIYIFKYPSSILYKLLGETQPSISYFLHLHSILHFKLNYIATFPLGSIDFVFMTFENLKIIKLLNKKDGTLNTPETSSILTLCADAKKNNLFCHFSTDLYKVIIF
jgi:hypothetical protein